MYYCYLSPLLCTELHSPCCRDIVNSALPTKSEIERKRIKTIYWPNLKTMCFHSVPFPSLNNSFVSHPEATNSWLMLCTVPMLDSPVALGSYREAHELQGYFGTASSVQQMGPFCTLQFYWAEQLCNTLLRKKAGISDVTLKGSDTRVWCGKGLHLWWSVEAVVREVPMMPIGCCARMSLWGNAMLVR